MVDELQNEARDHLVSEGASESRRRSAIKFHVLEYHLVIDIRWLQVHVIADLFRSNRSSFGTLWGLMTCCLQIARACSVATVPVNFAGRASKV